MDSGPRTQVMIDGMTCVNCARGVENVLKRLEIVDPNVDFASATATFKLPAQITLAEVKAAIENAGFRVHEANSEALPPWQSLEAKLAFSLLWSLPLMAHMFSDWHVLHDPLTQLLLCIPVFTLGLLHFGRSAIGSIRAGAANMDVLIVVGISAAFVYSLAGYLLHLGPNYLFFETAASITSLVLLGNVLEKRAVRQTTSALRELAQLQVVKTRRVLLNESGVEELEEVDARQICEGDVCQINCGDRVPVDGVVISGQGAVDESMLTGESIPLSKEAGAKLIGGTLLERGSLRMKAVAIGEGTVLAQIIRLVQEAQSQKPQIQRLGDKISSIFVPLVLSFSVITFVVTLFLLGESAGTALMRAVAVLVVACPCAMGLATPTAVMVGIGRAARAGILLRGGQTLEDLASLKTVVFDKTGTLTTGQFIVSNFEVFNGLEDKAKAIVKGLESHSSHPIAKSLVKAFSEIPAQTLTDVRETKGLGVEGKAASGEIYSLEAPRAADEKHRAFDLLLYCNNSPIAGLNLSDQIKAEASAVVEQLRRLNIQIVMLSGDRDEKCQDVGRKLGIKTIYSRHSPEQKLLRLKELEESSPTGYVGDGINDAPALSQARIGISLSDASQIAIQSSQVILQRGSLGALPEALHISHLTLRTIKQNLFWAFFYNILTIPLAAAGYLSPIVAAFSMALSDVFVIGNSLRLRLRQ